MTNISYVSTPAIVEIEEAFRRRCGLPPRDPDEPMAAPDRATELFEAHCAERGIAPWRYR